MTTQKPDILTKPPIGPPRQRRFRRRRSRRFFVFPAMLHEQLANAFPGLGIPDPGKPPAEVAKAAVAVERRKTVADLAANQLIFVKEHVEAQVQTRNDPGVQPGLTAPRSLIVGEIPASAAQISDARAS